MAPSSNSGAWKILGGGTPRRSKDLGFVLVVACASACGSESVTEEPGTQALFELPRGGAQTSEYYALPFPNDLRKKQSGPGIDFAGHSRSHDLIGEYLDYLEEHAEGFGTNGAVFFRFEAPIDVTSLPPDAAMAREEGASVYLVDVDPDSPSRGERWPLRFRFETASGYDIAENWLSILPYSGFPLRGDRTYAVVVTRRVTDLAGDGVVPSLDFAAVLGEGGDATVMAARAAYAPLLTWLDEPGGDEREDVAAATVFTTADPTRIVRMAREVVYRDADPPNPRDVMQISPEDGYTLFRGTYDGPIFQEGTIPYKVPEDGGAIPTTASGEPILQSMQPIRFAVSLPDGAPPASGWPVLIYTHGTGGDYLSFHYDGTGRRMAARGIAVLSHDGIHHGTRAPASTNVETAFFNVFNPNAAVTNVQQGAIDNYQLVRLANDLTIDTGGTDHTFDGERIFYMGHSQGCITGVPFLPFEPEIKGVIISGGGSLLYLSLLAKTEPINVAALIGSIIQDQPLDEFNNVLSLVQLYIDPGDSANYAPMLAAEPVDGVEPKHVFISQGLIDHYTPVPSIAALGVALQATPVAPVLDDQWEEGFALRGLSPVSAPVGNTLNGRSVVFLQYTSAAGSDGHFVLFDIAAAEKQHAEFLGTLARDGSATLVAP